MKKFILPLITLTVIFISCSLPTYYLEYQINNEATDEVMIIATTSTFEDTGVDTFFVSPNSCSTIFIDEIRRNTKDGFEKADIDTIWVNTFEIYKNGVRFNRAEKPIDNWNIKDKKGTSYFSILVNDDDF